MKLYIIKFMKSTLTSIFEVLFLVLSGKCNSRSSLNMSSSIEYNINKINTELI